MLVELSDDQLVTIVAALQHCRPAFGLNYLPMQDYRDKIDAALAALQEAQEPQPEWEPVPDGLYVYPNWDGNGEVGLEVSCGGENVDQWHSSNVNAIDNLSLWNGYRLCRRRP